MEERGKQVEEEACGGSSQLIPEWLNIACARHLSGGAERPAGVEGRGSEAGSDLERYFWSSWSCGAGCQGSQEVAPKFRASPSPQTQGSLQALAQSRRHLEPDGKRKPSQLS